MEDTNEPRLFRDKKGRLWMQRQGKYHLVSRHNGDWLPGGLSWSSRVKGHREYFENPELLERVVQDLSRLDWEIREMPCLERELRRRNWEIIEAETQKVLRHSLRRSICHGPLRLPFPPWEGRSKRIREFVLSKVR